MDAPTDCDTCPLCRRCDGFGFRETYRGPRAYRRDCDACRGRGVEPADGCALCARALAHRTEAA